MQTQLNEAARLRKEFDDFKKSLTDISTTHQTGTKGVITAYLKQAQFEYASDLERIKADRAFCEQIQGQDRSVLEKSFQEQALGFPTLSKAFADYLALRDEQIARQLETKAHPAQKAADTVRQLKAEKRDLVERCHMLQYLLLYYEELFPAIAEYREIDPLERARDTSTEDNPDPVRAWLTKEEYESLPHLQRLQLALDHYWKKRKSPWQLGRDYERYVGFQHEKEGYNVVYQGIIKGLDDCGRDLICRKGEELVIVQCKYWAQGKTIHEKHITQLFGTCVEFWVREMKESVSQIELFPEILKSRRIIPRFVTSTVLSETARGFAKALGVHVVENFPLKPYPCIKCNVSRTTGERIYHLPFDQQYDSTVIENDGVECYVETVADAEARGFRHSFRWQGDGE